MEAQTHRKFQLVLLIILAVAVLRFALIYRSRHQPAANSRTQVSTNIDPDYYVVPHKLRAYNLESAREIIKQPVWVKEGYRYVYYPYDAVRKRANLVQEAGTLGPIEKVQVKDVMQQKGPPAPPQVFTGSEGQPIKVRQGPVQLVLAVFEKDGNNFAVPIGDVTAGNYNIYADDIFFIQDPRSLYKHWPAEVWQAIEKHEIKRGMNELQASFAVGIGTPQPSGGDSSQKVVQYPNGGKSLVVTYRNGKAEDIKQSS